MSEKLSHSSHPSYTKTAAVFIIGNEILSGKVVDQNSPYLCKELRGLGVNVQRVVVIPDTPQVIGEEIRANRVFDLVFTTGGVGPTHDDVTMEGIALGVGRRTVQHPILEELLKKVYGSPLNDAQRKLAEVPEGTELINTEGLRLPVLRYENIYIFPGIPELLQKKFSAIKERFKQPPFFLKKIFLKGREEQIATHLNDTLRCFPELLLGSYPRWSQQEYDIYLTLESKDLSYLDKAHRYLLDLLPKEVIIEME